MHNPEKKDSTIEAEKPKMAPYAIAERGCDPEGERVKDGGLGVVRIGTLHGCHFLLKRPRVGVFSVFAVNLAEASM